MLLDAEKSKTTGIKFLWLLYLDLLAARCRYQPFEPYSIFLLNNINGFLEVRVLLEEK